MNIWINSDYHFDHNNIIKYENRPSDYNELLVKNHNQLVNPNDLTINLGDFALCSIERLSYYLNQLNGKHILVLGNHDNKRWTKYLELGFSFCCREFKLAWFGKHLVFTHRPLDTIPDDYYNIHGHLHSNPNHVALTKRHILISPELNDYKPIKLESLL